MLCWKPCSAVELEQPVNPSIAIPRPVAEHGWHLVQFYERDAFLVDEVGKFFQASLLRGDAALLIATPEHRQAVAAHRALNGMSEDSQGELAMFDAREMLARFMVGGLPDEALFLASVGATVRRACQGGTRRVAAFGEMVALLVEDGQTEGALRLEALWNELGAATPLSLMCAYPMRLFGGSEHVESFRHVCALHGAVRPVEGPRPEPDSDIASLTLAELQQKTIALHNEIDRRVAAEAALRRREDELSDWERERNSERIRLLADLHRASSAKDEFLAMLGHELRNPLAPIVTALQLMKMRGELASSKEQAIIQRQVDHLIRLVDDLLDVSRITRGQVQLRKETVAIAQVVAKAVEMAGMLFERRGHHLAIDVAPIGLTWHGDATRLAQVVANLLTNAARYTEPGGKVWLRARQEGAQVVIGVRDNGRGMEPEQLAHAFDLFFQGRQGVDRSEGGLGIGLALVRNLVELHGGTVTARSEGLGQGCEFTVRLPADVAAQDAGPRPPVPAEPRPAPAGEVRHVMIVDDNVDAADSLAALLQARGHHVQVVYDPVAALDLARGFAPDLALLDIGLPVMDGYELASQLRQLPALGLARFVALTGYGQSGDRERSVAAGFDHHLVKPVQVDELVRLVERAPSSPR
jgi:signal transduction histidine kinase